MNNIPKIGYTEFNEYTYELLKPYFIEWKLFQNSYTKSDFGDKIWWRIGKTKKELGFCYQHSLPFYSLEELTKINRIYECW